MLKDNIHDASLMLLSLFDDVYLEIIILILCYIFMHVIVNACLTWKACSMLAIHGVLDELG